MKSLLIALAISSASFSFASETANPKVLNAFKEDFSAVSSVTWRPVNNQGIYEGVFSHNGSELHVFYTAEGEMIGSSRYIKHEQLPLVVQQALAKRYGTLHMSTIIERVQDGATSYFVNLQSEKHTLMVQSTSDGALSVYKKTRI